MALLSNHAVGSDEQAAVACLRIDLYTALGQTSRSVAVGLEYLRQHLGIDWSPHPGDEDARCEYERIWLQLGSRSIEDLVELPLMSDPASLAALDVLTKLVSAVWHTNANLACMAICGAVNLSLERGNSDGSCYHYVSLGHIAGPRFGDYEAGFRFGQLGVPTGRKARPEALPSQDLQRLRSPRHTVDAARSNRARLFAKSA